MNAECRSKQKCSRTSHRTMWRKKEEEERERKKLHTRRANMAVILSADSVRRWDDGPYFG